MTDAEFLHHIESCTLPREEFTHRNHVRLAWLCLIQRDDRDPAERVAFTIQRYADSLGATRKYDRELTMAWMKVVEAAVAAAPVASFEAFALANPDLMTSTRVKSSRPDVLG